MENQNQPEQEVVTEQQKAAEGKPEAAPQEHEEDKKESKKEEKKDKKLKKENERLQDELNKALNAAQNAEAQYKEAMDARARAQAEFENAKKRMLQEKAQAKDAGFAEAILAMLPMMDNLERALSTADPEDALTKGVQMCYDGFFSELKKKGLEEIEAEGKDFDPNVHNAVMQEPCEEDEKHGKIAQVLQKGYQYKDKVIRYSTVKVYE